MFSLALWYEHEKRNAMFVLIAARQAVPVCDDVYLEIIRYLRCDRCSTLYTTDMHEHSCWCWFNRLQYPAMSEHREDYSPPLPKRVLQALLEEEEEKIEKVRFLRDQTFHRQRYFLTSPEPTPSVD